MPSKPSLTSYRQTNQSRSSVRDSPARLSISSVETGAWSSQGLTSTSAPPSQTPDLFNLLLSDRERVYRESTEVLASGIVQRIEPEPRRSIADRDEPSLRLEGTFREERTTNDPTHATESGLRESPCASYRANRNHLSNEGNMRLILHLEKGNPATKVSRRRRRPSTRDAAKSKANPEKIKFMKRSASKGADGERPSKAPKAESKANIGKKVDSGHLSLTADTPQEVIEIADSDNENENELKESSPEPPATMLRYLKRAQPQQEAQIPRKPLGTIAQDTDWSFPKEEPPYSETDLTPGSASHDAINDGKNVLEQLQSAQRESQIAQDTIKTLKQQMEKQNADFQLEKTKADTEAKMSIAKLKREVEAQRQESRVLARERDQLREQLEKQQDVLTRNANLEKELLSLQESCNQEKKARQEQQQHHADMLNDILKSKATAANGDTQAQAEEERLHTLEDENARLVKELDTLKAATISRPLLALSPVPSQSSSTDDDKRESNVRKMFVRTKRQYDVLLSVASNLVICTRSMDLSSFGEFGRYMKKLRSTLDLAKERTGPGAHTLVLRQQDDDDEWGSERSIHG